MCEEYDAEDDDNSDGDKSKFETEEEKKEAMKARQEKSNIYVRKTVK